MAWGHPLEDQICGQLDAGFLIAGFYEDDWGGASPLRAIIALRGP